jgi:hypothetical protein
VRRIWIGFTLILTVCLAGGASATASAADVTYSFRLLGPNTAVTTVTDEHHQAGDYIRVTGSGTFDPSSGSINAGGAWTHFNADGTVHMRGTWMAVSITSFTPVGGPKPSELGGELAMVVVHFDENGNPCTCDDHGTEIPMTVTSSINLAEGSEAGTTVGVFTDPTGGDVRFSLED